MNANYSEAIEQQYGLLSRLERGRQWWGDIEHECHDVLHRATPYFLASALEGAIVHAGTTAPMDWVLTESSLPSSNGFLWLDGDNLGITFQQPDTTHEDIDTAIRALVWGSVQIRAVDSGAVHEGIGLILAAPGVGTPFARPLFEATWRFGDSLQRTFARNALVIESKASRMADDIRQTSAGTPETEFAPLAMGLQFFTAFCLFVEQRIMVSAMRQAERHVRKRLLRDGRPGDASIHVIQLRRREQTSGSAVEPVEREWSCQWIVRGHWRQQPYPKAGDVKPLWITPYVKGPEDKPLKAPRATVFAVVR